MKIQNQEKESLSAKLEILSINQKKKKKEKKKGERERKSKTKKMGVDSRKLPKSPIVIKNNSRIMNKSKDQSNDIGISVTNPESCSAEHLIMHVLI